jgi:hypothetical protein
MPATVVNLSTLSVTESTGKANGSTVNAGGQTAILVDPVVGVNTSVTNTAIPATQPTSSQPVGSGSFVSVNAGTAGAPSATGASSDQPAALAEKSKPSAPTINWDKPIDVTAYQTSALSSTPAWVDDFLNHLGQTETQRNPNAAIRVRPTPAGVAGHA